MFSEPASVIPASVKRLFWDVDPEGVDPVRHRAFIIRRIADYGTLADVGWMKGSYSSEDIIAVIRSSRGLSRKTGAYWAAYYRIPLETIECLRPSYPRPLRPF